MCINYYCYLEIRLYFKIHCSTTLLSTLVYFATSHFAVSARSYRAGLSQKRGLRSALSPHKELCSRAVMWPQHHLLFSSESPPRTWNPFIAGTSRQSPHLVGPTDSGAQAGPEPPILVTVVPLSDVLPLSILCGKLFFLR